MLFVCIMLLFTFANTICFHSLSLGYRHIVYLFKILFCIMYSAFHRLASINYLHTFLKIKGDQLFGEIAPKNNHYYYYYIQ